MRDALPHASFIGFTGTPIELADANTRTVFGDYISIYDIQRAVEDGATVPIYYESRLAKLDLPEELKLTRNSRKGARKSSARKDSGRNGRSSKQSSHTASDSRLPTLRSTVLLRPKSSNISQNRSECSTRCGVLSGRVDVCSSPHRIGSAFATFSASTATSPHRSTLT
jgi:Type I site-specific restriction-modification system, R (restriction) subunit and related helicases